MTPKKRLNRLLLEEVEAEIARFNSRLQNAKDVCVDATDSWHLANTQESAALKRAALDLKNKLTEITKSYVHY